jgi:hypothetical protein
MGMEDILGKEMLKGYIDDAMKNKVKIHTD